MAFDLKIGSALQQSPEMCKRNRDLYVTKYVQLIWDQLVQV